jgi:hypothetical protein
MTTPFVPGANVLQVNAKYACLLEPCENVYYVLGAGAWDATSMSGLASVFATWEATYAAPMRGADTAFVGLHLRDLTTEFSATYDATYNTVGTHGGAFVPNNVTVAVKASTGLAGRSFRGRTYWIGFTTTMLSATTPNQVDSTAGAAIVSALNTLLTRTWPNSGKIVVFSRMHNKAWRTAGVSTPVLSYSLADLFMDSQRRRLPGHNR